VQTIVNGVEVSSVTVSASAVQEVRINQNPYSAEYSRPGRGGLEIITKEAASDYHGTFNFIFRDSVLNARDPFALVRAPEQRRIFEGAFSGPIGHSKTWSFMLSGHRQEEDLQSIVFAQDLSGPIQENVPSPKRDTLLSLHVGHQFSENHAAYWQYTEWEYPSSNQGLQRPAYHLAAPAVPVPIPGGLGAPRDDQCELHSENRSPGCVHFGRGTDGLAGDRTHPAIERGGELDPRQAFCEVRRECA
jgi:hypothetical protein